MEFKSTGEYLEEIGWGRYNLNVFFQCGMAWAAYMMWCAAIAYVLEGSAAEFGMAPIEVGLLGACFPFGLMIGAFVWGVVGDKHGRLIVLKITVILSAVFSLILTISMHPGMSAFALLGLGFAQAGEQAVAGSMFCEFCPPSKSSYLTRMAVFWGAGGTYIALIALIVVVTNTTAIYTWRYVVACGFILEVGCCCFRFFLEESPAYCQTTGQFDRMMNILNNVSKRNTGKEMHFDERLKNMRNQSIISVEKSKDVSSSVLMKTLFSGSNLRLVIIFAIMYSTSCFAYTSILYFMPVFLASLSPVVVYSIMLLQQALGIPGTMLGSWMVDTKLGRKFTIVIPFGLGGLCCFLFLIEANIICVVTSTSLMNFLAIMGYAAVYTITPESFTSDIRNLGCGFANIAARITSVISPIITGLLLGSSGGIDIAVTLFAILFGVTALSAIPLKETRPDPDSKSLLSKGDIN